MLVSHLASRNSDYRVANRRSEYPLLQGAKDAKRYEDWNN